MTKHFAQSFALAFALGVPVLGQSGLFRKPPRVTGPAPHLPDGTPDFFGVWMGGGSNSGDITKALKPGDSVVILSSAEKIFKGRRAADDPESLCLAFGIPTSAPYPWRLVQDRGRCSAPPHLPTDGLEVRPGANK